MENTIAEKLTINLQKSFQDAIDNVMQSVETKVSQQAEYLIIQSVKKHIENKAKEKLLSMVSKYVEEIVETEKIYNDKYLKDMVSEHIVNKTLDTKGINRFNTLVESNLKNNTMNELFQQITLLKKQIDEKYLQIVETMSCE
jgi:hypothetical protein